MNRNTKIIICQNIHMSLGKGMSPRDVSINVGLNEIRVCYVLNILKQVYIYPGIDFKEEEPLRIVIQSFNSLRI
jgi:hypothetical protein